MALQQNGRLNWAVTKKKIFLFTAVIFILGIQHFIYKKKNCKCVGVMWLCTRGNIIKYKGRNHISLSPGPHGSNIFFPRKMFIFRHLIFYLILFVWFFHTFCYLIGLAVFSPWRNGEKEEYVASIWKWTRLILTFTLIISITVNYADMRGSKHTTF